jgi:hypothetical protein
MNLYDEASNCLRSILNKNISRTKNDENNTSLSIEATLHGSAKTLAYYATLGDYNYSDCVHMHPYHYIGKRSLGVCICRDGTKRLLFESKQAATDHLLLCLILLECSGMKRRRRYCDKVMVHGEHINPRVAIQKNQVASKEAHLCPKDSQFCGKFPV